MNSHRQTALKIVFSLVLFSLFCSGCGQKVSGVFYQDIGSERLSLRQELDFRSDGSVILTYYGPKIQGTYTVSGDIVVVTYPRESKPYRYRIDGRDLIDLSSNNRLVRKN